jgi:hypothetical protein
VLAEDESLESLLASVILIWSLCPVARLKIKYSPGTDSANSLTRSLAASRSVATPSQRTLPPPCLLKMSNGGTIPYQLVLRQM